MNYHFTKGETSDEFTPQDAVVTPTEEIPVDLVASVPASVRYKSYK